MKQKKVMLFSAILLFGALSLATTGQALSHPWRQFKAEGIAPESETILYQQDFEDSAIGSLKDYVNVTDGVATIQSTELFTLPDVTLVESNNYEVDFDLTLTGGVYFFHFLGLDGNQANSNIYLRMEGNGAYWSFWDFNGHNVYNNSGDYHGGLNADAVNVTEPAHVKLIKFKEYIELWVNGTRRIATSLTSFGDSQYDPQQGRISITEGKITGFALNADTKGAVTIDNIKITEAKGLETSGSFTAASGSNTILPLSVQNLYLPNFRFETKFAINNTTSKDTYPNVKLFGLNGGPTSYRGNEASINVQFSDNGATLTPQICAQQLSTSGTGWNVVSGNQITRTAGEDLDMVIEVYGDTISLYLNGVKSISKSLSTDLGVMVKEAPRYLMIRPGTSGMNWTYARYDGYEEEGGARIEASSAQVNSGSKVTFRAYPFGKTDTYQWYVDDVATGVTDTTYARSDLTIGDHKIVYKGVTYASNELMVTVASAIATIAADKTEGYVTDTFTITATLEGDFSEQTMIWYVDDVAQEATETTLALSNLSIGSHKIVYKSETVTSNEIILNIIQGHVNVTSEKKSYGIDEEATFKADPVGLAGVMSYKWSVNGAEVANNTTDTLVLKMSDYGKGANIVISVEADGIKSSDYVVNVYYDIYQELSSDPNFQSLYKLPITKDGSYGNMAVGGEGDDLYLEAGTETGPYFSVTPTEMPTQAKYGYEYDLYIPEDISGTYYVYPCLIGADSRFPTQAIETDFEVNANGVRPYFKNQGATENFTDTLGLDLTYEGGIAKKGDWNHVRVYIEGTSIAMYWNNRMTIFATVSGLTIPTSLSFNMWPDAGDKVPLHVKNYELFAVREAAAALESVSISASAISGKAGDSITFTALGSPFNAEMNDITWYINGTAVNGEKGESMTHTFTEAGTYEVHCVVDGITSSSKTVTIASNSSTDISTTTSGGDNPAPSPKKGGCGGGVTVPSALGVAVIGLISALTLFIRKKKED